MSQEPYEIKGNCGRCKAEYGGRVTDKALESWGWRKINGKWICNLCSGAGYGGVYAQEGEPNV